ncbi:selenium-dependent xanthine dehydrogenase [Mycoplasmatota bacterium zrk1]
MSEFILNGKKIKDEDGLNLLEYLRDKMKLTSVKNGCNEGVCGTCTILVDSKPKRACTLTLEKVNGKSIVTLEGVDKAEKQVYADAFAKVGAVQCGFCIPGMIISAKGLIDNNPNPTREEAKKAIRLNLCRCTGYVKIIDAIMLAAEAFNKNKKIDFEDSRKVGAPMTRVDANAKALGEAIYADDVYLEDMLYGAVYRLDVPRAKIISINTSLAKSIDGVEAVLTYEDVPGENYQGYIFKDWPTMVPTGEETRYIGDAIAIVAAKTKKLAKEALTKIEVKYEELEPITSPQDALEVDANKIHVDGNLLSRTHVQKGDVEEAIKNSKHVVEHTFSTPATDHAFLEPESTVSFYQDGVLVVYSGSQSVHHDHHELVRVLGLSHEEIRVESKEIGGGFGGKEDLSIQHHAALLTYYTKKPVKITLSREDSLKVHPKRHAMDIKMSVGCDEEGFLTFVKANIIADTGAYASLGTAVLERACTHAAGPYKIKNIDLEGLCVYTNNPPAGAFRGFGVPQSNFPRETCIDLLADKVGIDRWTMRYQNAVEPGAYLPTGQLCEDDVALKETLMAVKDEFFKNDFVGIACAHKNTGIGVGLVDVGRCKLIVEDGSVVIYTSAARIGQGLSTAMIQIVSETLETELPIKMSASDSIYTPDAGATTASRQTMFTGEATRQAALKLNEELRNKTIDELNGHEFVGEYFGVTDSLKSDKEHPRNHVAYSFATQLVVLNEGKKIEKVVAAHDIGRAINPINIEGQIEGGVVMSLGYALTENFVLDKGKLKSKFGTLGLFRSINVPNIDPIIIEKNQSKLAYGAKGIGEISSIPTAAAIASAYRKFDGLLRLSLPLEDTPYKK